MYRRVCQRGSGSRAGRRWTNLSRDKAWSYGMRRGLRVGVGVGAETLSFVLNLVFFNMRRHFLPLLIYALLGMCAPFLVPLGQIGDAKRCVFSDASSNSPSHNCGVEASMSAAQSRTIVAACQRRTMFCAQESLMLELMSSLPAG